MTDDTLRAALDLVFPPDFDPANDEPVTIEGRDVWRLRHALAASAPDEGARHSQALRRPALRKLSHPHDGYPYDGCVCVCCEAIRTVLTCAALRSKELSDA